VHWEIINVSLKLAKEIWQQTTRSWSRTNKTKKVVRNLSHGATKTGIV
jgi:hypothetical protein